MRKYILSILFLGVCMTVQSQVHTSYLWHLHQPTYWGDVSQINPFRYQMVKESQDLKFSGANNDVNGLAHPTNDLEEIFGKGDRVNAYQHGCKNSIGTIKDLPEAGAQLTYGGSLMENINDLAQHNQWGYYPNWTNNIKEAKGWKTVGGFPRMEVVSFTMHHALSPLLSDRALKKEILAHQYYSKQLFGSHDSKGYWPAECSFSERIIKTLVECGIEWSVIPNSNLARTLSDYPIVPGTGGSMCDYPNKADQVPTTGGNWFSAQKDARGGQFSIPYCYLPHKAKYVDPENGQEYKITVVPMANYESYVDGYSPIGVEEIDRIAAVSSSRPPLVLLAHDGDNAWGGGDAYYNESVPNFSHAAAGKGYVPTTVPQYLADHPVPENDVVHVEDGSWVNADSDFGHPQFVNWIWPLYDPATKKFNPDGWTEDMMNQAITTAGEHHAIMAEDLEGGNLRIEQIVNPTSAISPAEKAWHFMMASYDSGNAYYGLAEDLEIKTTLGTNRCVEFAQPTIDAHPGVDFTKPSVFVPQRWPYNPGELGFGAPYGYKETLNPADFVVYTFAYDYSGIQKAELKYRVDNDGSNNLNTNDNETYAGGADVGEWRTLPMIEREFPKGNYVNAPEADIYMLPTVISNQYHAEIAGISEKLLDYYVEVTDKKGNITKTKIQHVWVGKNFDVSPKISFTPETNYSETAMEVTILAKDSTDPNPTIYYTTDGSTPTTASMSGVSSVPITITETTTVKVFAVDNEGNASEVTSKKFYIGDVPQITVHVKGLDGWTSANVHHWDAVPEGTVANSPWPGDAMTKSCDGWFSYTFTGISSTKVIFNNGGTQTADLEVNSDAWYDMATSSWVSGPSGGNGAPCLTLSPKGGQFSAGQTVAVTLSATDGDDASPMIYYTLDGSEPTVNSPSATSSTVVQLTSSTTLKVMTKDASGNTSAVQTEVYEFIDGPLAEGFSVYFKPPSGWPTPNIHFWSASPAGSATPTAWPGQAMEQHTDGWYRYTFPPEVESINVIFNNGSGGVGTNQTDDLTGVSAEYWYDWEEGELVGTNEFDYTDLHIAVYPNPTSNEVYYSTITDLSGLLVYDMNGQLIQQFDTPPTSVNLDAYPTGVYVFKFLTKNQKVIVKRVMKY